MKLSSIPLFCPCGSTKEKVRSALKPSISITFKRPAISSRVTARIERIPKALIYQNNFKLARYVYDRFCALYQEMYGEAFPSSFEQVVPSPLMSQQSPQ